jgi:hypothetical protein
MDKIEEIAEISQSRRTKRKKPEVIQRLEKISGQQFEREPLKLFMRPTFLKENVYGADKSD